MKVLGTLVIALGMTTWTAAALAQTRAQCKGGNCVYGFDDEAIDGAGLNAYGDLLAHRPPPKRVLLIRPRVSFVPEMLASMRRL